ncbi:MAG: methyltransferase domain-containing protein [Anaerolineales bacterium]|nr:methyltransferase domain-containing protein [Anaerolineales bacterium]
MNWRQRIDRWLAISVRRHHLDRDLESFQETISGHVLEIGAGHANRRGEFVPPFAAAKSWIFVDITRRGRPDVQADVLKLPLVNSVFQTAICLEVLEYVPDPVGALREIRRTLSPRARLMLSVPFMHRQDSTGDLWRFTRAGIEHIVRQAGFQVNEIRAQGAGLAVAAGILKFWLHNHPSRLWAGRLAYPFVQWLWRRDAQTAGAIASLADFSTGYLVLAQRDD